MNEITINIQELLELPDKSITDAETIRQIGLLSCTINNVSENDKYKLYYKINPRYEVCTLYPHIITSYNIKPEKYEC